MELSVGQVAKRAEVAVSALHFYEQKGLITSWRNQAISVAMTVLCYDELLLSKLDNN